MIRSPNPTQPYPTQPLGFPGLQMAGKIIRSSASNTINNLGTLLH